MNDVSVNVRMSSEISEKLDYLSLVNQKSRSEVVRSLVLSAYDQLKGNPALIEAIQKLQDVQQQLSVLSSQNY